MLNALIVFVLIGFVHSVPLNDINVSTLLFNPKKKTRINSVNINIKKIGCLGIYSCICYFIFDIVIGASQNA
jgi:hypothetical protein